MPRDRSYDPRDQSASRGGPDDPLRDALDLVGDRRASRRPSRPSAASGPSAAASGPSAAASGPSAAGAAASAGASAGPGPVLAPGPAAGSRRPARPRPSRRSRRYPAPGPRPRSRPRTRLAGGRRRIRLATVFALALFTAIGVRLVVLQVGQSPGARDLLVAQQRSRLVEIRLPAPRGSIVDRSGAVLARSVESRYVYADPELIEDAPAAAARLSPLLGVAPSRLTRLMARHKLPGGADARFAYLARGVDLAQADSVDALALAGIGTGRDERRQVPGADLAANLIGFTGADRTGLEGLEARYDDVLRGRDGRLVQERGNPGVDDGRLAKEIPSGHHRLTPARPGGTLHLTIDRDLQFQVQGALCPPLAEAGATLGAAVVLEVRTGEVLAQASCPGFNAAEPLRYEPAERADVASGLAAEPGSTHKAFVVAAALQEGVITADTTVPAGETLVRGGTPFTDDHPQPPRHPADRRAGARVLVERRHDRDRRPPRPPADLRLPAAVRPRPRHRRGHAGGERGPAAGPRGSGARRPPARSRSAPAWTRRCSRWPPGTRPSPTTARTSRRGWSAPPSTPTAGRPPPRRR
ncbi:hypothetical protein GCM10020358_44370 [Amorphoplanes nipponensis]